MQRKFIYGNYIDEVLLMKADGNDYYYAHDHLYSPAALINSSGTVLERYEYDAYGSCSILEPNFAPDPDGKSDYGNNYLFTGRRLDILNSGSLKIQYNRNRYYDYYTGRWLTHDPLGITPNPRGVNNGFVVTSQYVETSNLYEYVRSHPISESDALGLFMGLWDPRDIIYLGRFINHRYYGDGSLWTKGAANLRRQERLKELTAGELKYVAQTICQGMRHSGTCSERGTLNRSLTGPLCTTHGMRWSLDGPNPIFRITGSYEAFSSRIGMKCYCVVNFRNKYVWFDKGDLNYKKLPDQIYRALELYGFFYGHLPWPVDFDIYIRWRDNSRYISERRPDKTLKSYVAGWPFE